MLWPFVALGLIGSFLQHRLTVLGSEHLAAEQDPTPKILAGLCVGLVLGLLSSAPRLRRIRPALAGLLGLATMAIGLVTRRADVTFLSVGAVLVLRAGCRADDVRRGSVLHRVRLRGAWCAVVAATALACSALLVLAPELGCCGRASASQLDYAVGLVALVCGGALVAEDLGAARLVRRLCRLDLRPRPLDAYAGTTFDFVDLGVGDDELEGRSEGGYRGSGTPDTIVRGDPAEASRSIRRDAVTRGAVLVVAAAALHAALLFGL